MIYRTIQFKAAPFFYSLEFSDRVTLVRGNSATGKTYLYQMLEDLRLTEEYRKIRLFNYKSVDFHNNLKQSREKFVVIDNADLLLENDDKKFINFELSNQYLLFAHNCDGLNLSAGSFTVLVESDYKVSLKKELGLV